MTTRRELLQGLSALAATGVLGSEALANNTCTNTKQVLEIFLDGGLSCFETLMGRPTGFATPWTEDERLQCSDGVGPSAYNWTHDVAASPGGTALYRFTDAANPLFTSTGFDSQFRLVEMAHGLVPHHAAVPFAIAGTTLGRAEHAGMAAAVEDEHGPASSGPTSYVIDAGGRRTSLAAMPTGTLGAENSPVLVTAGDTQVVNGSLFDRTGRDTDDLLELYRNQYVDRLTSPGGLDSLRSPGLDGYRGALRHFLDPGSFGTTIVNASGTSEIDTGLNLASSLLALPDTRYVCVIIGNFDTHGTVVSTGASADHHNGKLDELLTKLEALFSSSLDCLTIAINTEFGRVLQGNGTGHYPYLYANLLLGAGLDGTVAARRNGRPYRPSELRAALLHQVDVNASGVLGASPDIYDTYLDGPIVQDIHAKLLG